MSFAMTTRQFKNRTKTVTRRFGWWNLQVGEIVMGVEKCMGFKKGEKIKRLGPIQIMSTKKEPLNAITQEDVIMEGFPDWTPEQFINMLVKHYSIKADEPVNRIEYKYIDWIEDETC